MMTPSQFCSITRPFTTFINKDVKGFYQIPLGWLVFKSAWINR